MEYRIQFLNIKRICLIGLSGMLISIFVPVYYSRNYGLSPDYVGGIILTGIIITFLLAYLNSKSTEIFKVAEKGLETEKDGFIYWSNILNYSIDEYDGNETLILKLKDTRKIKYINRINQSTNRTTFIEFREQVAKKIMELSTDSGLVPFEDPYDKNIYRYFGYGCIIFLILFTPFVLYKIIIGEFSIKHVSAIAVIYGSTLPFLARVFRSKIITEKSKESGI